MGEKFTEGAIIQHLAKLRQKMVANDMPVPPPLKRGTVVAPSKIYAPAGTKRKAPPPATDAPAGKPPTAQRSRKPRGRKPHDASDEEDSDVDVKLEGTDDSDGEYGVSVSNKKRRVSSKKAKKAIKQTARKEAEEEEAADRVAKVPANSAKEEEEKSEATEQGSDTNSPPARTRGVIQDYSKLEEGSNSDEEDEESLEPEDEDENENVNDVEPLKPMVKSDGEISPRTQVEVPAGLIVSLRVRVAPGMLSDTSKGQPNSLPMRTVAPLSINLTPAFSSTYGPDQHPYYHQNPYLPSPTALGNQYLPTPRTPSFATDRTASTVSLTAQQGPSTPTGTISSTYNPYSLRQAPQHFGSMDFPEFGGLFGGGLDTATGIDSANLSDGKRLR